MFVKMALLVSWVVSCYVMARWYRNYCLAHAHNDKYSYCNRTMCLTYGPHVHTLGPRELSVCAILALIPIAPLLIVGIYSAANRPTKLEKLELRRAELRRMEKELGIN